MLHVQDLEHPPQALDLRNFYSPLCIGRQFIFYRFSQVFFSHVSLSFMYATFKSSWLSVCVCVCACTCAVVCHAQMANMLILTPTSAKNALQILYYPAATLGARNPARHVEMAWRLSTRECARLTATSLTKLVVIMTSLLWMGEFALPFHVLLH